MKTIYSFLQFIREIISELRGIEEGDNEAENKSP